MRVRIGEQLLRDGLVTSEQLQVALNHQKTNGGRLGRALVTLGYVKDEEIASVLSRRYGIPRVTLEDVAIDPGAVKIIPAETARKYRVLPLSVSGVFLTLAMAEPTNVFAIDDIRFMTGYRIEPVVAAEGALQDALERHYGPAPSPAPKTVRAVVATPGLTLDDLASVGLSEVDLDSLSDDETDLETVEEADDEIDLGNLSRSVDADPVVKLTNVLLVDALKRGATDIHIEPYEKEFRVRYRIDGILYNVMALPLKLREPLTSRLKLMAKLDRGEKRLPQDGRIRIRMKVEDRSRELDFRMSCLPTSWGEKIALRLLDKSSLMPDVTKLGFEPSSLDRLRKAIASRHGIVLFAGPLGSGKTNTLYTALAALNKPDVNITTIEAPVTFHLPGINQIAVRADLGYNFPAALRSCLPQDTDVLAVDRIGDDETAKEVVRLAARSGRLVLATTLGLDAPSAMTTLAERGGPTSDLTSALRLLVAQRLVRRICANCKVEVAEVPTKTLLEIGVAPEEAGGFKLYEGNGCGTCNGTGYKGRIGLYEVMEVSEGIRDLVQVGAVPWEIKRKALEEGMLTLRMSGIEKIKAGITTIEEVLRETSL